MNRFLQYAEGRSDEILATLKDIVELESFTSDKAGVDRLGGWIKAWLVDAGASVEVLPNRSLGDNLLAHYGEGPHAVTEYIFVDSLAQRTALLGTLLTKMSI